ncbi:hypothetical protein [Frondihabitans sp. PAMC 28766]|uniref:hypothetical protein n=1 Tax=Frondihabitans sp. PAMC 28766 TaxID=1795630 RepID=UPI0012FFCB24|nr:hypothetical protein [Frondihabitans sp. PAMC 28766]
MPRTGGLDARGEHPLGQRPRFGPVVAGDHVDVLRDDGRHDVATTSSPTTN